MKKLLIILYTWLYIIQPSISQNPYWVFPPNYVNFKTGQVLPLPSGTTYTKTSATDICNGFFSQNGTSKFTLHDNSSRQKCYGGGINPTSIYARAKVYEALLIPNPSTCDQYYGLASDIVVGSSNNVLRLSNINKANPTSNYSNSNSIGKYLGGLDLDGIVSVAASALKWDQKNNDTYLNLYILNRNRITKYPISGKGINESSNQRQYSIPFLDNPCELELSRNERYLAWGDMYSDKLFLLDLLDSNPSTSLRTISSPGVARIKGIEFSANSNYLFFSKIGSSSLQPTAPDGIGVYDIQNNKFLPDVPTTQDLKDSQLELAIDGRIYGSNGTELKGFDSQNYMTGISKIYTVPNPKNTGFDPRDHTYGSIYTLIDQIDNADYEQFFTAQSCSPYQILPSSLTQSSYSASQYIKNTGTVTIPNNSTVSIRAGKYVELLPGFSTPTGNTSGSVVIEIGNCPSSVTPQGCTSYRLGTSEAMQESSITDMNQKATIYPNPIQSGMLNFSSKASSYRLLNYQGVQVRKGTNAQQINVTGLSKGLYLLHLDSEIHKVVIE